MKIISHRGYWLEAIERNQILAFQRSFDLGYGTELDVRDCAGKIIVSHDMPSGDEILLEDVLKILSGRQLLIALNIKSDGLADCVKNIFDRYGHFNWFVFDMAIPDMRSYFNKGVDTFTRLSDVEPLPAYLDRCVGLWLDAMEVLWYREEDLQHILSNSKRVCVVSEELHGRDYLYQWKMLKKFSDFDNLILCTDKPEQAAAYFRAS